MKLAIGNLWDYAVLGYAVTVPINIGWTTLGRGVMGRGVAKQAASKFPGLDRQVGELCQVYKSNMPTLVQRYFSDRDYTLVLFPVKPLADHPSQSWRNPADLKLIERSALQLHNLAQSYETLRSPGVVLPLVGCGAGGLSRSDVLPLLHELLAPDCF